MSSDNVLQDQQSQQRNVEQTKHNKLPTNDLKRYDSLDIESAKITRGPRGASMGGGGWGVVLPLAFQSIGVVYGDLGTSPLYVFSSIFPDGINHNDDILGALSLIFYTITLIPLIKYVLIVLHANDNGQGGTFALYSLICRYAKVGLIPSQELEDRNVSTFQLELPNNGTERASKLQSKLESSKFVKYMLLLATMLGTSMLIGDGILTPCISVLSAIGGIKEATHAMTEDRIVWASIGILVVLFMLQRFGTDKVGYTFAPILLLWFFSISAIGIYNFSTHDPSVAKAINPMYILHYFRRNKLQAWISLGGVVLCITGAEALFADLGHFSVRTIQLSMSCVIYPSIILAYAGQASFLRKNNSSVSNAFYDSIPKTVYWPMFVVAVLAAIIASQALISGTFSVIQQSLSLGCFPRVKVVHTSTNYPGQVYIPEINYLLMAACILVTLGFRTTAKIGNAYGIAVVCVMTLTSALLVLIMIIIWKTHVLLIISYVLIIGSIELVYLSSVLYKFNQGGYLPLLFALIMMTIMYVWNSVYRSKYFFELKNKISPEKVNEVVQETNSRRLPGLAIFYSELVHGIPPIFKHYVANVPALHTFLIFVSFKSLPISKVPVEERFLFRRVQPKELQVFRCVVRYGYAEVRTEEEPFEQLLIGRLKEFIRENDFSFQLITEGGDQIEDESATGDGQMAERDVEELEKARRSGVVHLVGEHEVVAAKGANIGKKVMINYAYNFLKKNLRQSNTAFDIPQKRMLKVGMIYEL